MEGGATVAGKSTANAQETLEASKDTAINKRPFNGISSREGANKQVISSQADSLIKISRIWAD
ncbi:hypothetical protein, partial [Klebsiella pneumoniae]|uniref:hypothetical protein n=2 Tax=Klebsiella pneumoniae TaxID=573 RepID=UPI001FB385AD